MKVFYSVSSLDDLSAKEVHAMFKLRVDVFVHEQHSPCPEIDAHDAHPATMHVRAVAAADRSLVATARVFAQTADDFLAELPTESATTINRDVFSNSGTLVWHIGRLCTAQHARRMGLGVDVLKQTLGWADDRDPSLPMVLTAQTPLRSYYEAHGFTQCGDEFDWDGIAHIPMVRPARQN